MNVTCVPLCGGVPACSSTCVMRSVVPLSGSTVAVLVRVMVAEDGARSGTLSQLTVRSPARTASPASLR